MSRHIIFACIVLMIGGAGPAQNIQTGRDANPGEVVVTGKTPKENKRICKSSVATGSIMPQKVCKKQSEWEEQRQRDLVAVERIVAEREARQHAQELNATAN